MWLVQETLPRWPEISPPLGLENLAKNCLQIIQSLSLQLQFCQFPFVNVMYIYISTSLCQLDCWPTVEHGMNGVNFYDLTDRSFMWKYALKSSVDVIWVGIDGFHNVIHHRNWRAKRSCDAISKQHGDVMPSSCHSDDAIEPIYSMCLLEFTLSDPSSFKLSNSNQSQHAKSFEVCKWLSW